MIKDALREAEARMKGAVKALTDDLAAIRTGRASPALVEKLPVDYYGTPTPLIQLATIAAPEPQMITIRPFDPTSVGTIEKAIQSSDLSLTPSNDGKIIRLMIPSMTEERRRDVARTVHKRVEEAKVAVRNIRRDAIHHIKVLQKDGDISEDDDRRAEHDIQLITDEHVKLVDEIVAVKEQELLEF